MLSTPWDFATYELAVVKRPMSNVLSECVLWFFRGVFEANTDLKDDVFYRGVRIWRTASIEIALHRVKKEAPIGIFDSGMGGLSVWREVCRLLPHESVIYLADGKHCPYGDRSKEEIADYTHRAVGELIARGAKLIVVACNTATAVAIDMLREEYEVPFVGMEPAVKPAALSTRSGTIGILATRASLSGELFRATSSRYASRVRILTSVGEGFVEAVEEGRESEPETLEKVRAALSPLLEAGADRIVLGCTHYPFLESAMREVIADRDVQLIDPAEAVARRVEWLLGRDNMRASEDHKAEYSFVTFGGDAYLARITTRAMEIAEEQ